MSKVTLKNYIIGEVVRDGGNDLSKEVLYERLTECEAEVVFTGEGDRHRWYTLYDNVLKVVIDQEERFFQDLFVDVHGECADRDDCGYPIPDLDDLVEMYPKEVMTTIYVTESSI